MSDLINRQDAIDAIMSVKRTDNIKSVALLIMDLPSAQPERKTGRWIYDAEAYPLGNPYGHYDCDQCGKSVPSRTNYCPNCGANMRGENDEGFN